jgi:hypothetical protein
MNTTINRRFSGAEAAPGRAGRHEWNEALALLLLLKSKPSAI